MENNKLLNEELQELKELQSKGNQLIFTLGQLEAQKTSIFKQIEEIQLKQDEFGKKLHEKYGDGNIDIETGEITKLD